MSTNTRIAESNKEKIFGPQEETSYIDLLVEYDLEHSFNVKKFKEEKMELLQEKK